MMFFSKSDWERVRASITKRLNLLSERVEKLEDKVFYFNNIIIKILRQHGIKADKILSEGIENLNRSMNKKVKLLISLHLSDFEEKIIRILDKQDNKINALTNQLEGERIDLQKKIDSLKFNVDNELYKRDKKTKKRSKK